MPVTMHARPVANAGVVAADAVDAEVEPHSDAPPGQRPPFAFLFIAQVPEPLQYCMAPSHGVVAL